MAVFGGFEKNLKRLVVADFPHHDDAGRLPQRGSQRQGKIGRIAVQFALVYRRSLVLVQKFDRIFHRQDVIEQYSLLIESINAASVEDLPDPVPPVTRMIPLRTFAASSNCGGSRREWNVGIAVGMTRITIAQLPRWMNTLTRKRAIPGNP